MVEYDRLISVAAAKYRGLKVIVIKVPRDRL